MDNSQTKGTLKLQGESYSCHGNSYSARLSPVLLGNSIFYLVCSYTLADKVTNADGRLGTRCRLRINPGNKVQFLYDREMCDTFLTNSKTTHWARSIQPKFYGLRFKNFLVSNGLGQVWRVSSHSTPKMSFALI